MTKKTVFKDAGIAITENENTIFIESLDTINTTNTKTTFIPINTINRCEVCNGTKELSRDIRDGITLCVDCL